MKGIKSKRKAVDRGRKNRRSGSRGSTLNVPSLTGDTGPSLSLNSTSRSRGDKKRAVKLGHRNKRNSSRQDSSMQNHLESESELTSLGSDEGSMNGGKTKVRKTADPDKLAIAWLQEGAGGEFETSRQALSRFRAQQNQRNQNYSIMCSKIDDLFGILKNLGGLTLAQRAQAAEAKKDLLDNFKEFSDEAMRLQLEEIMRGNRVLAAISKARVTCGTDVFRSRKGSPLPPAATSAFGLGIDGKEESEEEGKSRTDKKGAKAGGSGRIARKRGSSDDGSTDSDSFRGVRGSFGDDVHTAAGTLRHQVEEGGSSDEDDDDGDGGGEEAEEEDDENDHEEVDEEQDANKEGPEGTRWPKEDAYSDDEHNGPGSWTHGVQTPQSKKMAAAGSQEEDNYGKEDYESEDEVADGPTRDERQSWDEPDDQEPPDTGIESWVADQAVRLEETDVEFPEEPYIQHDDTQSPSQKGADGYGVIRELENGLGISHNSEVLPPPPARRITKTHSKAQAQHFPNMDIVLPDPKSSSDEAGKADGSSCESMESGLGGGASTAVTTHSKKIEGHVGGRSTMARPLVASGRGVKVKQKRLRIGQGRRRWKRGQNRHRPVKTSGRGTASRMKPDEGEQENRKRTTLDDVSKADTTHCIARGTTRITHITQTLPATPADLREALAGLIKAQATPWVELFWFLITVSYMGLYHMVQLLVDPVQSACARLEYWIEHPLSKVSVSCVSREARVVLVVQAWMVASLVVIQVYIALQRERAVWMDANSDTRIYLLEYMHKDPSWKWLPGVDPNLMFGWGNVKRFVWS